MHVCTETANEITLCVSVTHGNSQRNHVIKVMVIHDKTNNVIISLEAMHHSSESIQVVSQKSYHKCCRKVGFVCWLVA